MQVSDSDKTSPLNIRIKAKQRSIIEQAAHVVDKTVSDFVRDAAVREAQNALLDRTALSLNTKEWNKFIVALDAPPKNNKRLQALMARKPIWE